MVTLGGKKIRLLQGRDTPADRGVAEEKFCELRKLKREAPESPTGRVADVIEAFLAWSQKHVSPETQHGYQFYGQSFAERWGLVLASDLKPFHVTQWVDEREWGKTTEYNARRSIFRIFSWADDEGILPKNPLKGLRRPKPKPRQRALRPEEYRSMLGASDGPFRRLLFALRQTGARPKEVRTLRWTQVRSDRWVLEEHKTVAYTGKPRVIFLTRPMQKLMAFLRHRATSEYVFLNTRGRPWKNYAVCLRVQRLKRKLGLAADVCVYLARHAFGTNAILNGVDPMSLKELMGHSSLEMISTVYVHLADQHSHLNEAVEKATRACSTRQKDDRHQGV